MDLSVNQIKSKRPTWTVNTAVKPPAELAALSEVRHLQGHADLQAARHLQGQGGVARLSKPLAQSAQQLTASGVVERQAAELVIQEGAHPLGRLRHQQAGLNAGVQQLVPAAGRRRRSGEGRRRGKRAGSWGKGRARTLTG